MNHIERIKALQMRSMNLEAVAAAHVDAGVFGTGWIQVDEHGNLKRVDPTKIVISFVAEIDHD